MEVMSVSYLWTCQAIYLYKTDFFFLLCYNAIIFKAELFIVYLLT